MKIFQRWVNGGLLWAALALAGRTEVMLVPATVAVPELGTMTVRLVVTGGPQSWTVKSKLAARLHAGSARSQDVTLTLDPAAAEGVRQIPADGYLQLGYSFQLEAGITGPVVLEVTDQDIHPRPTPAMFAVELPEVAEIANAAAEKPTAEKSRPAIRDSALRRVTRLFPGISRYEPVYFGVGARNGMNAKFQFSLKYQPLDLWPAYISFTQTSLWDLEGDSKAFHDTAYKPRLFYLNEQMWTSKDQRAWFGLEAGVGHESNGKSGADSRSINIAYVRPRFIWVTANDYEFFAAPMIYGYLEKSENPDIADYRGYVDLVLGVTKNGWRLSATLRKGTEDGYGSAQIDAVMPLHSSERMFETIGVRGLNGYWFFQYFWGWGESILDYNKQVPSQLRTGIMLVP